MPREITVAEDWYSIENDLYRSIRNFEPDVFYQLDLIISNIDNMIQSLSKEEIECRRLQRPTLRYQKLIAKCNASIKEVEKLITYASLIQ